MKLHRWRWSDIRRPPPPLWPVAQASADGIELFLLAAVPVSRCLYQATKVQPLGHARPRLTAGTAENRLPGDRHGGCAP